MPTQQTPPWYDEAAVFFGPRYLRDYKQHLTEKQDTDQQVDFLKRVLGLTADERILDLACGHGRHAIALAQRGYRVTGQDTNDFFLEKARQDAEAAGVDVTWVKRDMRDIPFTDEFDAVVNLFTSFGYLENDQEDQKVLEQIAQALKPGGQFFLDTTNRERVIKNFQRRMWQENDDGSIVLIDHEMDFASGRMHDTRTWIEPDGSRETITIPLRMYTLAELARMCAAAGLALTKAYGDFNGSNYGIDTRRLILVAQKQ